MKTIIILIGSIIFFQGNIMAQENVLDNYVKLGLENNLVLKQKHESYEKSIEALREAKGLYFPDISLNARFSVSQGGRTIELPIGDLMNPVYSSLNGITGVMAQNGDILPTMIFPDTSINNEFINFLRPTEHETKVRIVQPIINAQIWNNYKIKKELINVEKANADTYRRYLVAEIRTSYYNYLKTVNLNELLDNTSILVLENNRVNQKLFENDKITLDIVLRSKAEISKLEQQKAEAIKNNQMAGAYLNFLLNRPLNEKIDILENDNMQINPLDLQMALNAAIANREELNSASSYINVAEQNIQLNQSSKLPTLTAVVDYGLQGAKYDFANLDDQDYVMASLILKWDLFKGFQNQAKTQQALIDRQIIGNQQKALSDQIKLQVINAYYDLQASEKSVISAKDEVESLEKVFKLVNKKYKLGKANLLEFTDARTSMTNAQQKLIITKYDHLIKLSELEKVTATYQFNN